MRLTLAVTGSVALALLLGCSQQEEPLEGERLDVRAPLDLPQETVEMGADALTFAVPPAENLASWTHRGGNARHKLSNLALSSVPEQIWSARIGSGDGRRHRITADPVVADGRIFTMDSRALVAATSTSGETIWQTDLTPATDRSDDASGGGLAVADGRLFVTSVFGRLTALDTGSGEVLWTQRLGAAASSAPLVHDGTVYVVSGASRAWAIDAETGRIDWEVTGTPSVSGVIGGGAPVVTDRLVVLPFQSAELVAVLPLSGIRVWTGSLSGERLGRVYSRITDVTGDPVVDGNVIYVGNPAGRSFALDAASGERIWSAEEGALSPQWVAGGSVFQISDQNELVRLDASTGQRIWGVQLPYFTRERVRRRFEIYDHYGPVLAGGRLLVASADDQIRMFDPATGLLLRSLPLPGGAASLPVVVNGTMYVVSARGQLHAFR